MDCRERIACALARGTPDRVPVMELAIDWKVMAGLGRAVSGVKALGAWCIKHTDGNVWPILGDIVDTGIDAVGPLEPGAGMDLGEVKRRYGRRVAVVGNVDVDLLSRGTQGEVVASVTALVREVSVGGGHILSSGNTIAASVRPENYRAMLRTARSLVTGRHTPDNPTAWR